MDNEDLLCEYTSSCVYRIIQFHFYSVLNIGDNEQNAKIIDATIVIDGLHDENVCVDAEFTTDFIQFEPVYGSPSQYKTEGKLFSQKFHGCYNKGCVS